MRLARSAPIYAVVLALTIVLASFLDADVSLQAGLRSIVLVVVGATLIVVILSAVFRKLLGGILAGVLILLARTGTLEHAALALVLVALVAAAFVLARRLRRDSAMLREPTSLLNGLSVLLLAATLISASLSGSLGRLGVVQGGPVSLLSPTEPREAGPPDIYILLLDGYPRADTLERLFGYDNRHFLERLQDMGFDVAPGATANYMYTGPTLASMHHMQYVQEIQGLGEIDVPFGVSLRHAINHNPVWTTLRQNGYDVAAIKPPWEHEAMRAADVFCGDSINDFEMFLVRTTLVGALLETVNPTFEADQHRAAVGEGLACLDLLIHSSGQPKLVFAHIGAPHLPIVFDASGGSAEPKFFGHTRQEIPVADADFSRAYVEQLQYLNDRVLQSLAELAKRSDQPVVIVMSDHGSESRLNWADAARSDLAERFSILFASRTPGRPDLFDCNVTPIDVYPVLLRTYLGTEVPQPTARHFVSPVEAKLDFDEVSDPDGQVACGD